MVPSRPRSAADMRMSPGRLPFSATLSQTTSPRRTTSASSSTTRSSPKTPGVPNTPHLTQPALKIAGRPRLSAQTIFFTILKLRRLSE
jgi:hypothetical protein